MDLLSAIRVSVWLQNIIGVSPYSVSNKDGIVAKKVSTLPGIFCFIFNIVSGIIGSQSNIQDQIGKATFDSEFSAGSVLMLTMMLGGICQMLAYFFTFFLSLWNRHNFVNFYTKLQKIGKKMQKVGGKLDFRNNYR